MYVCGNEGVLWANHSSHNTFHCATSDKLSNLLVFHVHTCLWVRVCSCARACVCARTCVHALAKHETIIQLNKTDTPHSICEWKTWYITSSVLYIMFMSTESQNTISRWNFKYSKHEKPIVAVQSNSQCIWIHHLLADSHLLQPVSQTIRVH